MKIRLTIMTENDKHVDIPKEELEREAKAGWDYLCNLINMNNDEKATVEKCEVVEM